jgi:alpha-tubulin suppressor-like RCC1 family protein
MSDRAVRCWGHNDDGQLGLGNIEDIGDNELPIDVDPVGLGAPAKKLAHGLSGDHMCAVMDDDSVRCWGNNEDGQLGLMHRENVGDTELPSEVPAVRVLK